MGADKQTETAIQADIGRSRKVDKLIFRQTLAEADRQGGRYSDRDSASIR